MGANLALSLSFELAKIRIQKVAFVDPWFKSSSWADKEGKYVNSEFKNKVRIFLFKVYCFMDLTLF